METDHKSENNMSTKPMGTLKFIHHAITDLMADYMFIMWFGMVLNTILVVYALLTGVNMIVFPDMTSTLCILFAVYGGINAIFLIMAYCFILEPHDREYTREERHDQYGRALVPMLVLWPLALPMWAGFSVSIIVSGIGWLIYTGYKMLENKLLKVSLLTNE